MDNFDDRIRARLVALAEAATTLPAAGGRSTLNRSHFRFRSGLSGGALGVAVVVGCLALIVRVAMEGSLPPAASPALANTPATAPASASSGLGTVSPSAIGSAASLPPGGIAMVDAIQLAARHTSLTYVSAQAGLFKDLNRDLNIGPGFVVKPDQWVWAVTYQGDMTICNPLGVCYSPRPGVVTVFLDYFTGRFLATEASSASP
jgi:hypothetical protein